nr:hypothetical protein Iba_chr04aCG15630 [Ipomoea batatas]
MDSCCCFDFHRSRRKSTEKERRSSTVVRQICSAVEGRNLAGHDMLLAIAVINHHHNGSQSARGGRGLLAGLYTLVHRCLKLVLPPTKLFQHAYKYPLQSKKKPIRPFHSSCWGQASNFLPFSPTRAHLSYSRGPSLNIPSHCGSCSIVDESNFFRSTSLASYSSSLSLVFPSESSLSSFFASCNPSESCNLPIDSYFQSNFIRSDLTVLGHSRPITLSFRVFNFSLPITNT